MEFALWQLRLPVLALLTLTQFIFIERASARTDSSVSLECSDPPAFVYSLTITGIDYAAVDGYSAIVRNEKTGDEDVFKRGDSPFGVAVITAIAPSQVALRQGKCEALLSFSGGRSYSLRKVAAGASARYESLIIDRMAELSARESDLFSAAFPWEDLRFEDHGGVIETFCPKGFNCGELPSAILLRSAEGVSWEDEGIGLANEWSEWRSDNFSGIKLGKLPAESILAKMGLEDGVAIYKVGRKKVRSPEDLRDALKNAQGLTEITFESSYGIMTMSALFLD